MRVRIPSSVRQSAAAVGVIVFAIALLVLARQVGSPERSASPPAATPSGPGTGPVTGSEAPVSPSGPPRPTQSGTLPSASSSSCVPRVERERLRVVTFNMHSARAHDGSVHLDTIAAALGSWDADVILLQEVDRFRAWTGRVDMPATLGDRLHMYWTFGANVRRGPRNHYGTAILSRYPISSARNVLLPAPAGTQQRGLLRATLDVDGVPVSVYDTHLENSSSTARLLQMRQIVPLLEADPRPKVLGGDFNAMPGSAVVATARRAATDSWTSIGAGAGFTHPAGDPRMRIDYLFHADGTETTIAPLRAEILPPAVSDHRPVRATYQLTAGHGEVCVPVVPRLSQGSH